MPRKTMNPVSMNSTLMPEWNYPKNNALGYFPDKIGGNSSINVWWIGSCGHEWDMTVGQRVRGQNCPYCSNRRVLAGFNDLSTTHPDIAAQWDREKNDKRPEEVTFGSHYVAHWRCSKGHSYPMSVKKKVGQNVGCPVCSGRRIVAGVNDFATLYPELAKQWHPTKNGSLKPTDISRESGKTIWWLGECGHEWPATPHDRVESGTGCPHCSARRLTSFPEQAIYYYIKKLYPDAQSRFTGLFENKMELDIYVPSIHFAVEFDGARWHEGEEAHERERIKYALCKEIGITLFRVKEETGEEWTDVGDLICYVPRKNRGDRLEWTIRGILSSIDRSTNAWTRKTFKIISDIDVDLERDENEIRAYMARVENSLVELRPDLLLDWDYEANGRLLPEMFGINSNERVAWKCHECGHKWKTAIIHRAGKRRSGCAICAKKKHGETFTKHRIAERGSLADVRPDLAAEWHPTLNGDLTPFDVTPNHNKKRWWLCKACNYEWPASPNNRVSKGSGCPRCSGRVPRKGQSLGDLYPAIAAEWHPVLNGAVKPTDVAPKSGIKRWWVCAKCRHQWSASPNSRVGKGSGCPHCSGRMPLNAFEKTKGIQKLNDYL